MRFLHLLSFYTKKCNFFTSGQLDFTFTFLMLFSTTFLHVFPHFYIINVCVCVQFNSKLSAVHLCAVMKLMRGQISQVITIAFMSMRTHLN